MSTALRFVDYFRHYIRAKTVAFDVNWDRTSGEGAYLLGKREHYSGLPIGMATPADCEGIKMEFNYGVAPSSVAGNGKMVHGLDVKMTMDQDWDFTLKPYNATVRGARIQAVSEDDVSGRVEGAYINAQAGGTKTIEGYISGATPAGPGIIGIQARTELATSAQITTTGATGVLIFCRIKQDADIIASQGLGFYRGLQVEVPMMGTGASIAGTTSAIHIGADWGGTDTFDYGLYMASGTCTTGIYCQAPIQVAMTQTTATTGTVRAIYGKQTSHSSMTSGNLVGVRGELTVGGSVSAAVALYGTQGKLILGANTITAASGICSAVLGQLNVTGSTVASGWLGAVHADIQGAGTGDWAISLFNGTATGAGFIHAMMTMITKSDYVFDLQSNASTKSMRTTTNVTGAGGWLRILVDGSVRYINLYTD